MKKLLILTAYGVLVRTCRAYWPVPMMPRSIKRRLGHRIRRLYEPQRAAVLCPAGRWFQ